MHVTCKFDSYEGNNDSSFMLKTSTISVQYFCINVIANEKNKYFSYLSIYTSILVTQVTHCITKDRSSVDLTTRGGARGEMFIVVGNEHGDSNSNPGRECLHIT